MFSLCSINSDGGECSQIPATGTSQSFQVCRIPAISDCTGREREILERNIEFWRKKI